MLFLRNQPADLSRYLPKFLLSDANFKAVLNACTYEHEKYRLLLDDLSNQFYVDTATWGLADWERILALKPSPTDDYEKRRKRILLYLQSHQISTVEYLEKLADRYITNGTTHITEHNRDSFFNIFIDNADLKNLRVDRAGLHEAMDLYKPAHLDYRLIAIPGRRFALNRCGPLVRVDIPGSEWTEIKQHIIFDNGLNGSGEVEPFEESETTTTQHTSYVFGSGTTNGRLKLNLSGEYSSEQKDLGGDVTDRWYVFTGAKTNSRASPTTNNAVKEERSRTYHVADWQDVINRHGKALNAAGGGKARRWTTSETRTWTERRYKRPAPFYALNKLGTKTTTRQDVGEDVELEEIIFTGGTIMNGGRPIYRQEENTSTKTILSTIFVDEGRLNGKGIAKANDAESRQDSRTESTTKVKVISTFMGGTLNGGLVANGCQHEIRRRTVHIPRWRDVVKRSGATLTNNVKHHTTTEEIKHTIPGRTEKKFNPKKGTLLNNHAVLGYMTL